MFVRGATSSNRDSNPRPAAKDRAASRYRAAQKIVKYAQGHRNRTHGAHSAGHKHG
jgi:hypothetical protein